MKTLTKGQIFSLRRTFSKEEVLLFSNLCGDKNPIHYDEEFCKHTIFKKPIIFGMLGSSLFSNLLGNNIEGSIYISQTLKFMRPVYIDEEIEAIVKIEDLVKPKDYLKLITQVRKLEKGELAVDGEAVIKFPKDKYNILI
jgi:3-hydroxybutyryl-CoA dehydratase